ncbi:hypothetical protein L228DRAFT_128965 [Xylona heveae TC161]|uniref:RFX-type winged-helix domain-containing protein n=1 Tax=Xylona heveae (strain CBS 132557 / TC161) TaxID=1328760 RepID=A0A165GTJ1_XYLHT|nr:hypothetical protein L228DRAFT_128965 [Xylona heveae TC161]KZF22579.1 hypothetical protein L228DRAFT_128965 [Xylona heveae TC161]
MSAHAARSRSSTSVSSRGHRRPLSRASTTSFHSTNTQVSQHNAADASFGIAQQHPQDANTFPYTHEEGLILQSAPQLTNPHGFVLDPALHGGMPHGMSYPAEGTFAENMAVAPSHPQPYPSFEDTQHAMFHAHNAAAAAAAAASRSASVVDMKPDDTTIKPKKGSSSSIANDNELRRLHRENKGRSIKEVACEVLANERGPKAEKTKQVFAMLWLDNVCKRSTGSVPRNRVYSHYATRCGTERVVPLNPASFGKLVRVIFPGIQTRRLGVRGESKYHYVDLSLSDDNQDGLDVERAGGRNGSISLGPPGNSNNNPRSQFPADTAVFPGPGLSSFGAYSQAFVQPSGTRQPVSGSLFIDLQGSSIERITSPTNMIQQQLHFSSSIDVPLEGYEPVVLPKIHEYTPEKTDTDIADALTALYRTHCTSLVDCIRFCKERQFFRLFTQFHGTLTVPVQKLLAHPNIAPWIAECDRLMYQKMIRFVAPLALQVIPKQVLDFLRLVSEKLCSHISATFQNHPAHLVQAKLNPAATFASLLSRLLRVNVTAHAAANMLCNDANRDQMWHDWVLFLRPVKVLETVLPNCGYAEALRILTSDVRNALEPLNTDPFLEAGTIYEAASFASANAPAQPQSIGVNGKSTENFLERWAGFLADLPKRFPQASTRVLLQCIESVGTAALRDLTIAGANSFGAWWVTKVWVDEMIRWLVEMGGFLDPLPPASPSATEVAMPSATSNHSISADSLFGGATAVGAAAAANAGNPPRPQSGMSTHADSRFSSIDVDFGTAPGGPEDNSNQERKPEHSHQQQQLHHGGVQHHIQQPQHHHRHSNSALDTAHHATPASAGFGGSVVEEQNHDDSGISIPLSDEDLALAKYGSFVTEGDSGSGANLGSDPTGSGDVVVC